MVCYNHYIMYQIQCSPFSFILSTNIGYLVLYSKYEMQSCRNLNPSLHCHIANESNHYNFYTPADRVPSTENVKVHIFHKYETAPGCGLPPAVDCPMPMNLVHKSAAKSRHRELYSYLFPWYGKCQNNPSLQSLNVKLYRQGCKFT